MCGQWFVMSDYVCAVNGLWAWAAAVTILSIALCFFCAKIDQESICVSVSLSESRVYTFLTLNYN